ncbi:prephenate dehydratase [Lysinibacillus endophyticus]|uniref:Prephenate dehydratase n=1 Tax=Ureibacillus endophyticus TaxID=1978490 RepID=A0A494ZBL2_9BACL|nr:prephenate dehydratase [Lysinibacillus endophyticus]MCP1145420.1 prephenate dehydratase [Lysinibacillus endophyticus]RKQ20183.1 prephenate dehydratase [Lysinibacillus endophyticus]
MKHQQWEKRIAYLGPEASFTYLATKGLFPNEWLMPFTTIPDCIEAVSNDRVDFAVVPVENALEGTVTLTIDYLYHEADLYVVGEVLSKIQQHLMVNKEQVNNWQNIEGVYSHSHALAQCHKYLFYRFSSVPLNQTSSTAAAAKYVAENPDKCIAAIGNTSSAEKYGLEIVERNIHDFHFNHTRFFVLAKKNSRLPIETSEGKSKTTFMLTLPENVSGALHQVLSVFAWRRIDLSKIESRPLKTGLGDYFFIIDVLADENEPMVKGAVEELGALGCTVKSLGTYYTYLTPE